MNRDAKNARTMRENERDNEGGREYGHVHQPSQTQEATNRRGLADDSMPGSAPPQQAPGPRQVESRRGSGTQQSRPPGNARKREHRREKEAA